MVWVRGTEPIKRKKNRRASDCLGVRTGFLTCDSITRNCVSLAVPGPPQRSRPVEVNKKDAFQDQCILFSQFMVPGRLTVLSTH